MSIGLIGRKCGMTRIFTEEGTSVPVTVIEVDDNRIAQIKLPETDGYTSIQVAAGSKKSQRVNKSEAGHFAKAGIEAASILKEFRVNAEEVGDLKVGDSLSVDIFADQNKVDVCGTSIGKGFAGVIKRHNFRTQDATHGNSLAHRAPGSIGQNQTPGRVFKGKKMAGHMGNARVTTQNLKLVRVDVERSLLLVQGAVPGHKGGRVVITPAVKSKKAK